MSEQLLETVAVRPGQSVWTVEAQCVETGTLYGIAAEPRLAAGLAGLLAEPGEMPPVIGAPESWQILWRLEPSEQDEYWDRHWRGEGCE